jgi:hypothetical protein
MRKRKPQLSSVRVPVLFTPEEAERLDKLMRRRKLDYRADLIRTWLEEDWERSETERKAKLAEKKAST